MAHSSASHHCVYINLLLLLYFFFRSLTTGCAFVSSGKVGLLGIEEGAQKNPRMTLIECPYDTTVSLLIPDRLQSLSTTNPFPTLLCLIDQLIHHRTGQDSGHVRLLAHRLIFDRVLRSRCAG